MAATVNNFTVIESVHGRFVVNRHCAHQAEHLIKTGHPHEHAELANILAIAATLPENCVVLDIGANIGLVAIPVAHAIRPKGGIVHAFEPQRMLFYALCGAAALNDLENLFACNNAVGSSPGMIKVPKVNYGKAADFGMVSLLDQTPQAPGETVPLCTIDGLGLARADLLKIDVEGMEIDVLVGARETIRRHRPWCWIEFWKTGGEPIKQQFEGLPYRFYQMDRLNLLAAPRERVEAAGVTTNAPEI